MKYKKKQGFTLIEMIAGLTVFIIVSTAIMSLILTTFSYNSLNKKTFDSNSMSKVFYEVVRGNRPGGTPYLTKSIYNAPGANYYIAFDNEEELTKAVKEKILKEEVIKTGAPQDTFTIGDCSDSDDFNSLKNKVGAMDNSYLMKLNIVNNQNEKVYEFTTTVWSVSKGENSSVQRKSLISTVS